MQDASSSHQHMSTSETAPAGLGTTCDAAAAIVPLLPQLNPAATTPTTTTTTTTSTATSMPSSADTPTSPSPNPVRVPSEDGPSVAEASGTVGVTGDADEEAAADTGNSDESIYGDQDDAQSFIQPAISPMATRLSLPRTPAAERAKHIAGSSSSGGGGGGGGGGLLNDYFDGRMPAKHLRPAAKPGTAAATAAGAGAGAAATSGFGSTATTVSGLASRRLQAGRAAVLNATARHNRSSSVGSDALKRLSKALPSLSFPKGPSTFFPSLPTPSFFSSVTSPTSPTSRKILPAVHNEQQPPSVASRPSYSLHRTTSDDSLLYHTLSRVSSLGDDDNFDNIREQVNSRVKAIMDSFPDRPTFKLPSQ